jgi:hypothetical protein
MPGNPADMSASETGYQPTHPKLIQNLKLFCDRCMSLQCHQQPRALQQQQQQLAYLLNQCEAQPHQSAQLHQTAANTVWQRP